MADLTLSVSLSVIAKRGARISFATDPASRIILSNADRAIIPLGSNDLNDCVCEPKQLAADILNIARRFIRVDSFRKVAICQLCYCYPPSSASRVSYPLRPRYNMLVDEVSAELRHLILFFPATHFWKHLGMLLDYRSLVSDGGLHLRCPEGECRYFRSIRGAALFLSKC